MGTYTLPLKEVLEFVYGTDPDPHNYVQEYAAFTFKESTYGKLPTVPDPTLIGLGTYPIFDEEYRPILNGKIIDEYYNQEIGTETIDNWTLMIRRKMDQIMPYFNQLYLSLDIPYSALDTMKIHSVSSANTDESQKANASNNSLSDTDGNGRAVSSNTPQTMLSGREDYASAATDNVSKSKTTANSDQKTDATGETKTASDNLVTGYQAAASDLINKYRLSLINVDTSILAELQDCFMALLNNGDEYHSNYFYYPSWVY